MSENATIPDVGLCGQIACVLEVTARKAGNVHRFADFADVSYLDFLLSAAAIGPVLARAPEHRVGDTVLACVRATQAVMRTNTNLGIILLLSPLAAVLPGDDLRRGVDRILAGLDVDDARQVYEAIRLANPGGLGQAPQQDVRDQPTLALRDVMALAADRDLVARQYAHDFADVFDDGVPTLQRELTVTRSWETAIVRTHLHLMVRYPDTLIARKCGQVEAEESSRRARLALDGDAAAFAELDAWLRARGHDRNPGATADLLTACLFVVLREGTLKLPLSHDWA